MENLCGSLGGSVGDTRFWGVAVANLLGVDCFLRKGILSFEVDGPATFDDEDEAGG
jgi:hypothetical protein